MKKLSREGDVVTIPKHSGKWLVERTEYTGGGMAMFHDEYPDAWHVTARKLHKNGKYDPKGRKITFTQDTNSYNNCIDGVVTVGKMTRYWK